MILDDDFKNVLRKRLGDSKVVQVSDQVERAAGGAFVYVRVWVPSAAASKEEQARRLAEQMDKLNETKWW